MQPTILHLHPFKNEGKHWFLKEWPVTAYPFIAYLYAYEFPNRVLTQYIQIGSVDKQLYLSVQEWLRDNGRALNLPYSVILSRWLKQWDDKNTSRANYAVFLRTNDAKIALGDWIRESSIEEFATGSDQLTIIRPNPEFDTKKVTIVAIAVLFVVVVAIIKSIL